MKCVQVRGRSGFDTAGMKEASSVWHEAAMRFESTELGWESPNVASELRAMALMGSARCPSGRSSTEEHVGTWGMGRDERRRRIFVHGRAQRCCALVESGG